MNIPQGGWPGPTSQVFPAGVVLDAEFDDFEAMAAMPRMWDQHYLKLTRGSFVGVVRGVHTPAMQVGWVSWSSGVLVTGAVPRGAMTFGIPTGAEGPARTHGVPVRANHIVSVADRDELNFLQPAGGGVFCLSLGHEVLDLVSATFFGAPWSAVAPAAPVLSVRDDGRLLAEFRRMQALATSVDPLRLADPIFSRRLELSAAESLMAQVTIGPLRPVPAAQRRRLAQRAEAFLRANEKRPVGIAELCAAVGAPERTLQLAFREYFGLPPIAYLRVRRLHHVRRQLLELGARTSVTATATDWGFDHLGEFSVAYRRLFGETPSQTLRR